MPILIKNGLVYDGSGNPPIQTDILINNEIIARIGTISKKMSETIDASHAIVMPGFVDIHPSIDDRFAILEESFHMRLLANGITTMIGGNCGISLAPFAHVRDIPSNINWHSLKDFFRTLKKRILGINFGTLVGHTTLRQMLLQNACCDLTDQEMKTLLYMITQSLDEGAFGISVGFEDRCSAQTPFYELKAIAEIAAQKEKIFATHMRNEKEMTDIARETNAHVHIGHLQTPKGKHGQYTYLRTLIEENISDGCVSLDCSPALKELPPFPHTIIASHGNYQTFQNLLLSTLRGRNLPAHTTIQKMTSLPAETYRIKKRGYIKEGYYADIVIMKENKITDVMVNGIFAYINGTRAYSFNGAILKSTHQ